MKLFTHLTLGKKITFLTTIALVTAIVVFGYLAIRAVNQVTDAMLQDRLTTAHLVSDYLDEVLGRALTELSSTAKSITGDEPSSSLESHVGELEDTYHRLSFHVSGIYLVNEQGKIIWSKPMTSALEGKDISFYPNVSLALKGGQPSISSLVMAPETDIPVILLTSPTSKGALVMATNLAQSRIGGFVQPVRLGQTGYVEVVDQNGIVVVRTQPGPQLAPFEKSDHSGRFAALIADGKATRGLCHTCHEPVQRVERRDMLAFVPLSQTKWGVAIRQSEEEALAPIRELQQNLLLFGAGLIILVFLFVVLTTRDVVSRIRMLTAASQKIAGGDLTGQVAASGKDEIGQLAQSFEDMRTNLKTSREELEQRTKELSSLLSVSEVLTSLPDLSNLDTALGSALDKTLDIMKADTGGILLLDDEGQKLRYKVHRGLSDKYAEEVQMSLGEGIAGRVAQTGEPILVEDISADHRAAYSSLIAGEGLRGFASVPLRSKSKVLGVLNVASRDAQKFSPQDVRLLEGIARQIATAIENARLHQEVQRKDEVRGELLREILTIQEEERRRIARELHDETSQVLASLSANLEAASGMLPADSERVKARLKEAQNLSISVLDEVHRLIYELRPSLLDDLGLVTAVRWLLENNLQAVGVKVGFKTVGRTKRLPPQLEATLFRVIQEAVNNIARHARAENAEVILQFKRGAICIQIKDDGQGFDVREAISSKDRPRGFGLLGMKERVELANGALSIHSQPGSGTEIDIEIPLSKEVLHEHE
ncbi:MAG: GAF domain-containing protein [Chloroflexi bacterium]|nr:GAF domain-containing protein [Chloroflexota bacterium]